MGFVGLSRWWMLRFSSKNDGCGNGSGGTGSGTGARPKTKVAVSAVATRSATKHYLFGHCGQMNLNQLPQCIDIIRFQYYLKGNAIAAPDVFFEDIITTLKSIWDRASIL